MANETPDETPRERRLKLALVMIYGELCELEQFAGTTDVLRPIVRAQHLCRWDDPEWEALMDEAEAEEAAAAAEEEG